MRTSDHVELLRIQDKQTKESVRLHCCEVDEVKNKKQKKSIQIKANYEKYNSTFISANKIGQR